MGERFVVVKIEALAGAQPCDSEELALAEATKRANKDNELLAVVRVVAEVRRDPTPAAIVTRFE